MSIEHQPPVEKGKEVTNQSLQVYLLNGQEVQLTKEQATVLGAQKIGHSGDLGLENPAKGAQPVTHDMHVHPDDLPQTMPFNTKDRVQAREVQKKNKKFPLWVKLGAGGLALSTAVGVGAILTTAKKANDTIEGLADQNTSAPQAPGASESVDSEPTPSYTDLEPPLFQYPELSYEDARQPGTLTAEQASSWNSGDHEAKQQIASDVLAMRTSYAIHDLYRTKETGESLDLSYITDDPLVIEKLASTIDELPSDDLTYMFEVCRYNADYSADNVCHPQYASVPIDLAPEGDNPAYLRINEQTDNDPGHTNLDYVKTFELNIEPVVDSDGVMKWVSK